MKNVLISGAAIFLAVSALFILLRLRGVHYSTNPEDDPNEALFVRPTIPANVAGLVGKSISSIPPVQAFMQEVGGY